MSIFNFKKNKVVSTEFMSKEEYIKAIEGPIMDVLVDKVVLEKTGVKDLFANNIKIKNKMSYEDVCDCLIRLKSMVHNIVDVYVRFNEEAEPYHDESYKERKEALMNRGSGKSVSKYENDFFSADTVLRIAKDVCEEGRTRYEDIPDNYDDALNSLNQHLNGMKQIKSILFRSILITAGTAFAPMTGYKSA